jgi:hypothetical protein
MNCDASELSWHFRKEIDCATLETVSTGKPAFSSSG